MKKVTVTYMPGEGWRVDWTNNEGNSGFEEFLLFSEASDFVEGRLFA